MPEGTSNSIVNLGELSKPADTLIKKISNAVGGFCKPYQIKRVAKAEAEAALIKTQNEIQITDLKLRAMCRFVEEEAKRQNNIESITAKALPQLNGNADPSKLEDDWITNFFDKCRIISDNEMQGLWSRVLAGEANLPGTYSKRTVNFLSDLDKSDAEKFTRLCGFVWTVGNEISPLIYSYKDKDSIYNKQGINFELLNHLDSIGLIQLNDTGEYVLQNVPKKIVALYYGATLVLEMPNDTKNEIIIGQVLFTKIGEELAPICGSKPVEGFLEYVTKGWKDLEYIPEDKTEQINTTKNIPTEQ